MATILKKRLELSSSSLQELGVEIQKYPWSVMPYVADLIDKLVGVEGRYAGSGNVKLEFGKIKEIGGTIDGDSVSLTIRMEEAGEFATAAHAYALAAYINIIFRGWVGEWDIRYVSVDRMGRGSAHNISVGFQPKS